MFDEDQRVTHAAISENKWLGEILANVKERCDQPVEPDAKTNSVKNRYKLRGGKPERRTEFKNELAINARRQKGMSRQHSSERMPIQ